MIFLYENKIRKIHTIFDIENWLWKSDLGTFDEPFESQIKKYFFKNSFLEKNLHPIDHTNQYYLCIVLLNTDI